MDDMKPEALGQGLLHSMSHPEGGEVYSAGLAVLGMHTLAGHAGALHCADCQYEGAIYSALIGARSLWLGWERAAHPFPCLLQLDDAACVGGSKQQQQQHGAWHWSPARSHTVSSRILQGTSAHAAWALGSKCLHALH
jgi:hypothetical protein